MRVAVTLACSILAICAWCLVRGRIFLFLFLLFQPNLALASCTTSTVTMGDGRLMLCTTCCNANGVCDTHCF
jgi:hypothetical protein